MKLSKVKINFLYNIFYQVLILVLPIITVPYVSRILKPEGVGVFSYTYSFASYFVLLSMLGIANYGSRMIAKVRDDKKSLSREFLSIYTVQVLSTVIMTFIYLITTLFLVRDYCVVRTIEIIYIISCLLDITWFFYGLEKFIITVIRSTIIKILSVLSILLFVKSENDLYIYVLIQSLSVLITSISVFPFLRRYIEPYKIEKEDIVKHVKPCIILFIPVIAVSLYKIMDKIMLGALANVEEVGFYEQAEKIINIPLGLITSLGLTLMPKISNLVANKNVKLIKDYIYKSIIFVMFLSFPIVFGLISVAKDFIPLFLGDSFLSSVNILYFLSVTIIFISIGNIIIQEYLIPFEKDKIFIYSSFIGAIINLVLNFILITNYKSTGAAIATVFAEAFVVLYEITSVRKVLDIKKYLKVGIPFFIKAFIMFIITFSISFLNINVILKIIVEVLTGVIIYLLLNLSYIKEIIDIRLRK